MNRGDIVDDTYIVGPIVTAPLYRPEVAEEITRRYAEFRIPRPPSYAGRLRAVADWLDHIDEAADAALVAAGQDGIGSAIQDDLREIAVFLDR